MKFALTGTVSALTSALTASSLATIVYDESVAGDLSGIFVSPTPIQTTNGTSTIIGSIGLSGGDGATDGSDADYFTLIIPPGASILSLNVDAFTFEPHDPGSSFLGYTAGSEFTGQMAEDINGSAFFNAGSDEILGFLHSGPLGAGTHSFWIQETAPTMVNYSITFTQIPEPAIATLGLAAMAALSLRRRRESTRSSRK